MASSSAASLGEICRTDLRFLSDCRLTEPGAVGRSLIVTFEQRIGNYAAHSDSLHFCRAPTRLSVICSKTRARTAEAGRDVDGRPCRARPYDGPLWRFLSVRLRRVDGEPSDPCRSIDLVAF